MVKYVEIFAHEKLFKEDFKLDVAIPSFTNTDSGTKATIEKFIRDRPVSQEEVLKMEKREKRS